MSFIHLLSLGGLLCLPAISQIPDQRLSAVNAQFQIEGSIHAVGNQVLMTDYYPGSVVVIEKGADDIWQTVSPIHVASLTNRSFLVGSSNRIAIWSTQDSSIYLYEQDAAGDWNTLQTIAPPVISTRSFSFSLTMSPDGRWLMVGAPAEYHPGHPGGGFYSTGTIYAYEWDAQSHAYLLRQEVFPPSPTITDGLGEDVTMTNDRLVASSWYGFPGAGFALSDFYFDGTSWVYADLLPAISDRSEGFRMRGEELLVWESVHSGGSGDIVVFQRTGQGATASWGVLQSLPLVAGWTGKLAWDTDDRFHLSVPHEVLRYERSGGSGTFQEIASVYPFATGADHTARNVLAYSSDEYVATYFRGISVARPGQQWLGEALVYPNGLTASGGSATLSAAGSIHTSDNDITFHLGWATPGQFGYLLGSRTYMESPVPGASGDLLLGGSLIRFKDLIRRTDATGSFSIPIDLIDIPGPTPNAIYSHEEWYFQVWMRDPQYGSVFTNGVYIYFL